MKIQVLEWAGGVFCALIGALMLIAPHQFGSPAYQTLQTNLNLWGVLFLLAGSGLLAVAALQPNRAPTLVAHWLAGGTFLLLAWGFEGVAAWRAVTLYGILGLGMVAAPLVAAPKRPGARDLLTLLAAVLAVGMGATHLLVPQPLFVALDDAALRPYGAAVIGSGLLLLVTQIRHGRPAWLDWAARLLVAAAFASWVLLSSLPNRTWTGVALYGGLGALVLLQPYLERCLGRIDPNSLRTRLALALAAAAAVPLVLAMALVTGQQANLAMRQALAAQETLANALAEGVADYIALHQAAVAALAAEPDLLDLPSARQTLILKAAKASYPDAYEYATIDADGAIVARTGVGPAEDIAMQDVFRAAQRGDASTVEILLSANAGQPLFGFGAPVYDGMGRFDGMVAGTLASARLSDLLRDVSGGDALAFLVDGGGRLIAQPERPPTDEPRDLSELPPVAVFLAHGGGRGSLQYQLPEGAMLAAYATVPRLGWGVVVERPRAVALAPVRSGRELVFGLLIVGIIAAGLIGALIARGLAAPLGRLAQAADTLAAGEDAAPLPRSRLEEVAHLADAFGQMRSRLAERTAQRERTEAFLRQERDFSDMVINSLPGVFYLVDASGRLLRWNRRLEQVAGFTADDAGQRRLAASVVPGDRPAVLAAMEQVLQEGRASLEAMLIVEGGTPAPYYFTGSRLYIDGEAYVVGMGVDIRERKAAEDEVRRLNAQLEQRVAERTAELEAFNYSVAHDLRAPLRGIDGFGQALLDDYGDTLDDTARTYLQRIRAAAGRMGGLIDGLLNLARLSRRELALGEVDLSAMARDVVAELASHHPERRVAVEIEAGLTAQGDARLLEIVLENLLGNAWKFTQGRENACIAFGARIMSGQMVYFVQDNGAGFDMAYAHKLFVAFQRLHRPGEFEGTGIGLATVDRIIRRHGGRVWAEGQEGKGATFFFTLTLDTAAGATPTA